MAEFPLDGGKFCQAQRSWLALISVYYQPTDQNSLKMANLAYIEGKTDL